MANSDDVKLSEAANELYRLPDTLRKYAQRRKIPAKKILGKWYLPKAWVEEQKKAPQQSLTTTEKRPGAVSPPLDLLTMRRVEKHQQDMLKLVKRWRDELSVPLWCYPLRDLGKPGLHREFVKAGLELLMWEVEESGDIRLCCPLEVSDDLETTIVRGFLYQHLKTSKYSWLLEREMPRWKILGGQDLAKRCQLLEKVDQIVQNRSGLSLKGADRQDAGPTWDFSNTIWAAAVDGVYGNLPYGVENAQGGVRSVRYGGFSIALACAEEEVEKYRRWHRKLMLLFGKAEEALCRDEQGTICQPANDTEAALRKAAEVDLREAAKSLFNDIVELKEQRGSVTKALQRGLMEISVVGHVPSQCDFPNCT